MSSVNKSGEAAERSAASVVFTIYCHIHTESGRRYVGQTKKTMLKRWNQHVYTANGKMKGWSHFANAIRVYGKDAFSHEVLEVCHDLDSANEAEKRWIAHFDTTNPEKGFNFKSGGDHQPHPVRNPWDRPGFREKHPVTIGACHTPEARARSKAALNTPESRARRSAAAKSVMADPTVQERRRAFQDDPAYRERIAESLRASLSDPDARARQSEAARLANARPEVKERISAAAKEAFSDPEVKARHSAAVREAQSRPELLERRRVYRASPETRAKISAASTGRKHSPEVVARMKDLYWSRIVSAVLAA